MSREEERYAIFKEMAVFKENAGVNYG